MKLAIVTSHPIQYNAPFFQLLAKRRRVIFKVFYTWEQSRSGPKYDPDFGRDIQWDIPLLEGYEYSFVRNTSKEPGTHHFKGIVNPTLNKEIESWGPDALLVYGWSFDGHLRCLRHFHNRVPVFFRGDSTLLDETPGIRRLLRKLFLRWVYHHVDYALYVGENNRRYFQSAGLGRERLIYAPHAVDNARFEEPDDGYRMEAASWRERLGIRTDDVVLLFAGKFEPKKNPFFLLTIAGLIDDPRLRVVLVGNGVLEAGLKDAAKADPRIVFLDFQNQAQMPAIYRIGDIFILPSVGPGETWGLAANEAMASGDVVMLSDRTGGAIDLVEDGHNGLIFDPESPEKCIGFIKALVQDRRQLAAMKAASRERINEFSYAKMVDAVESIASIRTTRYNQ